MRDTAPGDPAPKLYGAGDAAFEGAVADQALAEGAFADLAREQAAADEGDPQPMHRPVPLPGVDPMS